MLEEFVKEIEKHEQKLSANTTRADVIDEDDVKVRFEKTANGQMSAVLPGLGTIQQPCMPYACMISKQRAQTFRDLSTNSNLRVEHTTRIHLRIHVIEPRGMDTGCAFATT